MLVYFFPNNGDHAWSCGCASAHHWREPGCICFETILLLSHPSVRFGVWVIFIWIVRFKLHGWYWPHHHHRLQPSAARNPPLPAAVSHLWDGCPWSYTFQNQWVHPYPDLLFSPSNLWEISSTRGEKTWQIWSIAVRKPLILFFLLLFPTSCFGSSSHDHNALHSWWKFVHIKILSAHNFDWYPTRQRLCSVCFWQFFFFLLEIGLTVMSFKWSPECKNMLHGFSPRSPVPSGVSTHLKLSFRWGDNCIFLLTAQNQAWFFNGRINIHI